MSKTREIFVNHHIAELAGVNPKLLNDPDLLIKTVTQVAEDLKLTILNTFIHRFEPHGLSLIMIISQSHIAIHTWPEYGYLHMDILTCSEHTELSNLEETLKKAFNPQKIDSKKIDY